MSQYGGDYVVNVDIFLSYVEDEDDAMRRAEYVLDYASDAMDGQRTKIVSISRLGESECEE